MESEPADHQVTPISSPTLIRQQYHQDFPFSFSARDRVIHHFKPEYNTAEINHQLSTSEAFTRFKSFRKRRGQNPVYVYKKRDQVQADICFMPHDDDHKEVNNECIFMVVFIDVFTKYVWVYPTQKKDGKETTACLQQFLASCGSPPARLSTDRGGEFINKLFRRLCLDNNIELILTNSNHHKCVVVERFNRTIQRILYQQMHVGDRKDWTVLLPEALRIYHFRKHRTIKMTPHAAEQNINQDQVLKAHLLRYSKARAPRTPKFKVGQLVRMVLNQDKKSNHFQRGYQPSFTFEAFEIVQVLSNLSLPRYTCMDMNNNLLTVGQGQLKKMTTFFENELVLYSPPMRPPYIIEEILLQENQQYFIHWKGYNEKNFNSWIDNNMLQRLKLLPENKHLRT